jgi:hypothetical protein
MATHIAGKQLLFCGLVQEHLFAGAYLVDSPVEAD